MSNDSSVTTKAALAVADDEPWVPNKPIEDVSDEELKASPLFLRVKQGAVFPGPGGKMITLPDESILPIARDTWRDVFAMIQTARFSDDILRVFDALDEAGIEHDNEITIRRRDGLGEYKLPRSGGSRFKHEDYSALIGYGEGDDKLKLLAKHGGFVVKKTGMKKPEKNGTYELLIEEGLKGNAVTDKFVAKLYQYPDDGRKVPCIIFPPKSGDKNKLVTDDDVREVASMSKMMKAAVLNVPQTPAVIFDLGSKLSVIRGEDNTDENAGGDDAAAKTDEKPAAKAETKPAAPAAKPGKAAARLLSDDD